jgi:polyisoprenoid-binding protein YceI
MKRIQLAASVMMVALLAAGCGKVGNAPEAKTGTAAVVEVPIGGKTLPIDTSKSRITWVGAKITASHEGGFRKFDGTVTVDNGAVTATKINIDANSIYTEPEKLVSHLKSDDFFKVARFPTATFEATKFAPADAAAPAGTTHMVTGNLTMAGRTNSVTFPATITVDGDKVTAKAAFKINRQEWGITYPGAPDDLISNDIQIMFDVTAGA